MVINNVLVNGWVALTLELEWQSLPLNDTVQEYIFFQHSSVCLDPDLEIKVEPSSFYVAIGQISTSAASNVD